ncbi:hypothetical protein C7382_1274 [Porphyromonas loveana]|uniref:Uncharacterized protein n=1 Tax=Porphyromonas loveana TaxID=1884669 RepID=A0A2U1EZC9_9PORP|nr:hypothetical protein C7382_1274 [Porphyromonas loveana]
MSIRIQMENHGWLELFQCLHLKWHYNYGNYLYLSHLQAPWRSFYLHQQTTRSIYLWLPFSLRMEKVALKPLGLAILLRMKLIDCVY